MEFPEIYQQYMYSYPHKTAYYNLPKLDIADYFPKTEQETCSLYFHIPFCETKCGYCNLFSVTGQKEDFLSLYLDAIERQAIQYLDMMEKNINSHSYFDSFIFGGGTPLLLSEKQLERLFQIAYQFPLKKNIPMIVETSPRQTTKNKLQILKQYGVTRLSIGIQSFHEQELLSLNRDHTVEDCKKALTLIEDIGFSCRNIDLIYGISGQTKQSLKYSIDAALSYQPEELFLYPLYIKQGTRLYLKKEKVSKQQYDFYLFASQYLKEQGYEQISMRRFVRALETNDHSIQKKSFDIKREEKSCGFENTLSLGCGGRSYLKNLHFCTPYHINPSACLQEIQHFIKQKDNRKISFGYLLNGDEMLRRYIIKNLLHQNGIDKKDYRKVKEICSQYQYYDIIKETSSIFEDFPILSQLLEQELAIQKEQRIILTEKGISYSDAIGPLFISNTVKKRMRQWIDAK